MIKKAAILGAILGFLPPLACASSDTPFNGLYIGGEVGMVYGQFQHTSNSVHTGGNIIPPFQTPDGASADDQASDLGAAAGLHLGYGHVFNRFYLGAEANGDFQTVSVNSHSINSITSSGSVSDVMLPNTTFTGRLTNAYGLTLRPGYLLSPTVMVYLKGGVEGTHLKGSSTTFYPNAAGVSVLSTTASGSKNVVGWLAGFGIEKRAANHFGFRAEDLISGYGGVNATTIVNGNATSFPSTAYTVNNSTHITPFTNTIMIGVDYFFS